MNKKRLSIIPESQGACSKGVRLNVFSPQDGAFKGRFGGRAAVVTLGCAKNQVDSEVMVGVLRNRGYEVVSDVDTADVAIVNTCGFLESAVKESIDAVLELGEKKTSGRLRRLIVAGCAVERYREELKASLPEVDAFVLTSDLLKIGDIADGSNEDLLADAGRPYFLYDDTMPREVTSGKHYAYVKISEGCDRPCTFCIIPKIRGEMRSRKLDSVVDEVKRLGDQGVKEVNLVAQDLTNYGVDIRGPRLVKLLEALNDTGAVDWIRLHYAYPVGTDSELIDAISNLPRVVKYLDIPLQHSSEGVLKAMKRPIGKFSPRKITEFIRNRGPSIKIRTTFIVGFPGETEDDVGDLESFIREGHFSSVGIFTYSPEKEAQSSSYKGQILAAKKQSRLERLMLAQQEVAFGQMREYIGQTLKVLVEGTHEETDLLLKGRCEWQAPEVDSVVLINDVELSGGRVNFGQFGNVRITETSGYDLVGTLID